jgi:lysophospholipase L1-like esterase
MAAVLNGDLADGVHPNAVGYVKMGQAWASGFFSAVENGLLK